jgi:hypothetical protein
MCLEREKKKKEKKIINKLFLNLFLPAFLSPLFLLIVTLKKTRPHDRSLSLNRGYVDFAMWGRYKVPY